MIFCELQKSTMQKSLSPPHISQMRYPQSACHTGRKFGGLNSKTWYRMEIDTDHSMSPIGECTDSFNYNKVLKERGMGGGRGPLCHRCCHGAMCSHHASLRNDTRKWTQGCMDVTYPTEQPPSLWLSTRSMGSLRASSFLTLLAGSTLGAPRAALPSCPPPDLCLHLPDSGGYGVSLPNS